MKGEIKITELVTVTPAGELTYDGYKVPHVHVSWRETKGPELSGWVLILDDSFVITVPKESELGRWVPILANGMAVAAGYTSHGSHSTTRNPHGPSPVCDPV